MLSCYECICGHAIFLCGLVCEFPCSLVIKDISSLVIKVYVGVLFLCVTIVVLSCYISVWPHSERICRLAMDVYVVLFVNESLVMLYQYVASF